jgi:GDP-4-dehydro-6-deoxy-D-mannose reductase
MKVLITGISGFVGVRLARRLRAAGHALAGTYIRERPELEGIELHEADLLDPAALDATFAAARPDGVIHLAGLAHVGDSWRQMADYFRVNVLGTENLVRAAAGCPTVVASSAEVYGLVPEEEQPMTEERQVAPQSPYALTKAAAERVALASGARVVRSFNLVGPGQSAQFALPSFARQLAAIAAKRSEPVLAVGNLDARRDFLHVDDGVEGYEQVLQSGTDGEVYNLGSGRARSIREMLDLLVEVSGIRVSTRVDADRWRPVDLPLLEADASRLRALGWKPHRAVREALEELWVEASAS